MTARFVADQTALREALVKRTRDWLRSTSESYVPVHTDAWIEGLASYLMNGPGALSDVVRPREAAVREAWQMADDERAAKAIAAESADRFRDVLSEALGYPDANPGDDVLISVLRQHFGKTGPEPTRWRDFVAGAKAQVDQIDAARAAALATDPGMDRPAVAEDGQDPRNSGTGGAR